MEMTFLGVNVINLIIYAVLLGIVFAWVKSLFKPYGVSSWYYVSESYDKKSRSKRFKDEYKRRFMNEDSSVRRSSSI